MCFYPIDILEILAYSFTTLSIILDKKNKVYLPPRFPRGSSRKVTLFSMGLYEYLFKNAYNFYTQSFLIFKIHRHLE